MFFPQQQNNLGLRIEDTYFFIGFVDCSQMLYFFRHSQLALLLARFCLFSYAAIIFFVLYITSDDYGLNIWDVVP